MFDTVVGREQMDQVADIVTASLSQRARSAARIAVLGASGVTGAANVQAYRRSGLTVSLLQDSVVDFTLLAHRLRSEHITFLDVAAPAHTHVPVLEALIDEMGASCPAVLMPEPLAPTVREAATLLELARRNGIPLAVNLSSRWVPGFVRVARLVRDGAIGMPRLATVLSRGYCETAADDHAGPPHRTAREMAVHHIDLMCWMFGFPDWVFARMGHASGLVFSSDDVAVFNFGFHPSLTVHVVEDWMCRDFASPSGHPVREELVISGESGVATATRQEVQLVGARSESLWCIPRAGLAESLAGPMLDLIAAVDAGVAPTTDPQMHVKVLEILEAAVQSSQQEALVRLLR